MFKRAFLIMSVILTLLSIGYGCLDSVNWNGKAKSDAIESKALYPQARFIVISDIHYYDKSLGISGKAFEDSLRKDRKLLVLSKEIFSSVVHEIQKENADFVIVPGDLTKDGEEVNHRAVVRGLKKIARSGKRVFVVPGNHDVANRNAVRFVDDKTEPVKNISGDGFAKLYSDLGYSNAIERDTDSLSYVAEPIPGLWLMALDSCRWKENSSSKGPFHGGAFSKETLDWINGMLVLAKKKNKAVIAFMHHGLLEHYPSNEKYYPKYLVKNHTHFSKMLAENNVHMVFTGHFHAQDITGKRFKSPGAFIFDIETGSLVTYPCPYRIVGISSDQTVEIKSRFVTSIKSREKDLSSYARDFVFKGTITRADVALIRYKVNREDRQIISPQIAKAYMAHLEGDEKKPNVTINDQGVSVWGRFIILMQRDLVDGWWTDLPPADNFLKIDLKKGHILEE